MSSCGTVVDRPKVMFTLTDYSPCRAASSSASFSILTGFAGVFRLRNARPDGAEGTDRLAVDGRIAPPHQVHTVVVGNCGKLLAEWVLMPAARCEDVEHGRDT